MQAQFLFVACFKGLTSLCVSDYIISVVTPLRFLFKFILNGPPTELLGKARYMGPKLLPSL